MLTTVRHIFGRIMHSETVLCSQWDKGWKNNLLFASPSIRRPTLCLFFFFEKGQLIGRVQGNFLFVHHVQQFGD